MAVSSYGQRATSSGVVRILKDLDRDIAGRHVIVVEDIVDSGLTLSWLLKYLESRSAASVEVVALLRKPDAIKVQVPVKYVGFDIPSEFVVGYGLDFAERYRELPYVGVLQARRSTPAGNARTPPSSGVRFRAQRSVFCPVYGRTSYAVRHSACHGVPSNSRGFPRVRRRGQAGNVVTGGSCVPRTR